MEKDGWKTHGKPLATIRGLAAPGYKLGADRQILRTPDLIGFEKNFIFVFLGGCPRLAHTRTRVIVLS